MSIMNGIDLTRLSRILAPNMQNQQQVQQPQRPDMNIPDINAGQDEQLNRALLALLTPKDEQYDRFTQMLQQMPQRDQYEPTKGRRIAAALMGLGTASPAAYVGGKAVGFKADIPGSLKVQQSVLDEPYNTALSDWTGKAGNTLEAAKLENTRNVNSRVSGSNLKSAQLKEQGLDRQLARDKQLQKEGDQRIAASQAKMEIDKKKQDALDFKNSHTDYKTLTREDGQIMFYNPKDPTAKPIDSGLKGTDLSDMEKIQLQHEGRMEEITARGDQARQTSDSNSGDRGWSVQDNYDPDTGKWIGKIRVNSITGESVPIKGAQGPKTPPKKDTEDSETQKKQGLINKANQIVSSNPELKGYIVFDKNNSNNVTGVRIRPRGMFGNEPFYDEEKAMKAYQMLFGENKPKVDNSSDKVLMTSPDGRKGYVPSSQVEAAKKQGYK